MTLSYNPEIANPILTGLEVNGLKLRPVELDDELGSVIKATIFLEAQRFLGSRFDWFAGFSRMRTKANGKSVYRIGPVKTSFGFLNSNGEDDHSAYAWQLGFRYTVPASFLNEPKFGVEFNRGSRYWWGINYGSEDPLSKLAVRGYVWDFYYLQPVSRYFSVRIGLTMVQYYYNRSGSMMNEPGRIDETVRNTYFLMDAKF